MAFLPGVFGRGNPQPQQPAAQQPNQAAPQNRGPQQGQQQPGNGNGSGGPAGQMQQPANSQMQPGGNQNPGGNQQPENTNPLDAYFKLMTPGEDVQKQLQQQQQQQNAPLFGGLTTEAIQEQVGKTNFAQNLNPESVQKALGGDQQSFMEVLNQVAQNAFSASLQMSKGMVEQGVQVGHDRFSSSMDSRFRDLQLRNKNSENPALQHPIGQALLGTIKKQIATANPRMNADQVHSKAEEMFGEFGKLLNPSQQGIGQSESQQGNQTNWLQFLDPDNQGV